MKDTIRSRLVVMGLITMLITALFTTIMFHRIFNRQIQHNLQLTAENLATVTTLLEDPAGLNDFSQAGAMRITLIDSTGKILYDSNTSQLQENLLDRPEVQDALNKGSGRSIRTRGSLRYNTYYFAVLTPTGNVLRISQDAATLFSIFNGALPVLVIVCVLVLLGAVALSFLLTRQLVRPISCMATHLDEIQDHVPYKELEPFAQAIQRDVSLRQQNAQMRQEFTANVSHELKTPLTSIRGYAELIETGMAKPNDISIFAGRIHAETDRLLALIQDILKLNELDQLPAPLVFTAVDLRALAGVCTQRLTLNARNAFVTLRAEGPATVVQGDQSLLETLCYNLCDNAIRYNRPGGTAVVRTGQSPEGPYLEVQDTGIGIPEEHQPRVFERFYRVDKSRSRATGGTGLGLAIVKHCTLVHSAQLMLHSVPGEGTCIRVTFPPQGIG